MKMTEIDNIKAYSAETRRSKVFKSKIVKRLCVCVCVALYSREIIIYYL